jgi:hypothetical protein
MSDFQLTLYSFYAMFIYGFIAILDQNLSFDWRLAGGIILFCFVIESLSYFIISSFEKTPKSRSR